MVGWQEGHLTNTIPLILRAPPPEQVEEENPRGTGRPRFTWKNRH